LITFRWEFKTSLLIEDRVSISLGLRLNITRIHSLSVSCQYNAYLNSSVQRTSQNLLNKIFNNLKGYKNFGHYHLRQNSLKTQKYFYHLRKFSEGFEWASPIFRNTSDLREHSYFVFVQTSEIFVWFCVCVSKLCTLPWQSSSFLAFAHASLEIDWRGELSLSRINHNCCKCQREEIKQTVAL
jgi:hypothetical protein